jgi:hypothetical protein
MLSLHALALVLQVGVPAVLLVWIACGRNASLARWLMKVTAVLLYIAAAHIVGFWVLMPWYTAGLFAVVWAGVVLSQIPRIRRLPWRAAQPAWLPVVGCSGLAIFAILAIILAGVGRRLPSATVVDLEFPLRDGEYYVVGGGSVELLNPHLMTLNAESFRAYRGQSYGNDLLKLGAFGLRASGLLPADPARYAIYGDSVHAPCAGLVIRVQDGAPDMPPPQPDRTNMAGNHVLMECAGVHVLLAHLQRGSVRVRPGQHLETGAIVGVVGNSGNSNEPHLHIHAQRPASPGEEPLSGDPLPMRFNGRYLVRNDRIATRR